MLHTKVCVHVIIVGTLLYLKERDYRALMVVDQAMRANVYTVETVSISAAQVRDSKFTPTHGRGYN